MGSCYSLPHKSHLKSPHPGKRAGKEAFLSRGFPSSAHTTSSSAWGVTKPIWKHHLCTCFQDSFVSTWSLSRRIRVHKSRATTSTTTFSSLQAFPGSTSVQQSRSLGEHLLAVVVPLQCLWGLGADRAPISQAEALLSHPAESRQSLLLFPCNGGCETWRLGEKFAIFCNKERILTCGQDVGAAM